MTVWLLSTCVLIAALILLRRVLRGRVDPRLTYALWLLAALRILFPGNLFPSPVSVDALADRSGLTAVVEHVRYGEVDTEGNIPDDNSPTESNGGVQAVNVSVPAQVPVRPAPGPAEQTEPNGNDRFTPLFLVWGIGAALVAAWFLLVNVRFALRLRRSRKPFPAEPPVPCSLRVYVVQDLPSPCLFGLFRPAVYLNRAAEHGRLDHILTHELAHFRHGDPWWAVVRCVCLAVQWFNPLVWAAAWLSRQDCELACDTAAVNTLGEAERLSYGRTLVGMIDPSRSPASVFHTATTMNGTVDSIRERIALIARRPRMTFVTFAAALLAAALAAGCTFGGAAEGSESVPPDAQPLSEGEPGELVRSVYEAVTGCEKFSIHVGEGDDEREYRLLRGHPTLPYSLSAFDWQRTETDEPPAGTVLTLKSETGDAWLRCWSDSALVELRRDGSEIRLLAAPPSNSGDSGQDSVYLCLLPTAEMLVWDEAFGQSNYLGNVISEQDVLSPYMLDVTAALRTLPAWVRWKPLEVHPREFQLFQRYYKADMPNFSASVSWLVRLDAAAKALWTQYGDWTVTPAPEDAYTNWSSYTDWWIYTTKVAFLSDSSTDVHVNRPSSDGSLLLPVDPAAASLPELYDTLHFLTPGPCTSTIVRSILTRFSPEEINAALLEFHPDTRWQAQSICRCLGDFLREYGGTEGIPSYAEVREALTQSSFEVTLEQGVLAQYKADIPVYAWDGNQFVAK